MFWNVNAIPPPRTAAMLKKSALQRRDVANEAGRAPHERSAWWIRPNPPQRRHPHLR